METTDPVTLAVHEHEQVIQRANEMVRESKARRDEVIRREAKTRRQVDIVRASGLTRESIRRICNP